MMSRVPKRVVLSLLLAMACDDEETSDCPNVDTADLNCPLEIDHFEMSACGPGEDPTPMVEIDATITADSLHVQISNIFFREGNEICGFVAVVESDVRILLQPCVLVTENGVNKADCWYDSLAFDIEGIELSGVKQVTVSKRLDHPMEFPPDTPKELGSVMIQQ